MATADLQNTLSPKPPGLDPVHSLPDSIKNIALQTDEESETSENPIPNVSSHPFFSYSRSQILFLNKSPLVRCPEGMPELKEWFGDWNEQFTAKKDADSSAVSSSNRDRRFRRDPEDSESTTARPSFRTSLTQPSQMGNFRHQSTRTNDRDRDKDLDKDKDRDRATNDGQDRLRSLSDKYDRDRLGLASSSNAIRRDRDRDAAPHLSTQISTRSGNQTTLPAASRRPETRDAPKRRNVESSDDWRRVGAEPPRLSRDEKSDGYRRDRETRERPRSRARDSSRQQREVSSSRKDRDRDEKDKDRDRERYRDREDRNERPVRGMDHYSPPREKEMTDDSRRWRDDGKREERLAARRERDRDARDRERMVFDGERDTASDRTRDRDRERWHVDERDVTRPKRTSGRDRKYADDEKDEQRGKAREGDKEKVPAWMETYVPNDSHAGILGGQSADGELDDIQAWKKGMKEKEKEEKDKQISPAETKDVSDALGPVSRQPENQMDEIQLFKMLIKREAEKKEVEKRPSPAISPLADSVVDESPAPAVNHEQHYAPVTGVMHNSTPLPSSISATASAATMDASNSLLSLITSPPGDSHITTGKPSAPSLDSQKNSASRFFPNSLNSDSGVITSKVDKQPAERVSSTSALEYNPPQSSRLLALSSRTPSGSGAHSSKVQSSSVMPTSISPGPQHPIQQLHALQTPPDLVAPPDVQFRLQAEPSFVLNQRSGSVRQHEPFSPFDHGGRGIPFEEKDPFGQQYDGHRRTSGLSGVSSESGVYDVSNGNGGFIVNGVQTSTFDLPAMGSQAGSYSSGKGSRFAKFFDSKGREAPAATGMKPAGIPSPSPLPGHRQDINRLHMENQGDGRTMEDIFAMLQSSAQGQRIVQPSHPNQTSMLGNSSFGSGLSLQHQQTQQHGPLQPNGRLDPLYDSRFDDKSFVPDGMVPGLRTIPRARDIGNSYIADHSEEQIPFGMSRPLPQLRNGDMFNANGPQVYPHQQGFVRNAPMQQPYRGNPSPIASQNPLQTLPQQRLPPGLANLGGRPPHDSTQFFGNAISLQSGPQGGVLNPGLSQPTFSNYQSGGLSFPGGPQMRTSSNQHHLQGIVGHNPLVGLGLPNNIDVRAPNQAQMLGLRGGYGSQQLAHAQLQAQQLGLRQQQHMPQNMVPHIPHLQQQPGGHNQPAQDLMALLMGNNGPHRE